MEIPTSAARKLELVYSHCVAKSANHPNEDSFALDVDRQIFVLSDGASISYDSARWSEILVSRFVTNPKIDQEWLSVARQEFSAAHEYENLPWNKQAAFERGSYATILGLTYNPVSGKAKVVGVGDSVVVMIDDAGNWITSYPYEDVMQFRQDPILLSTKPDLNSAPEVSIQPLPLSEHPGTITLLLMTDALGAWCLEHRYSGALRLTELADLQDFIEFLRTEQQAQRMRVDDATLMVLKLSGAV